MPTVVIFDSGVGGLSVYQQVKARLPNCHYVYIGDNYAYPYGDKSESQVAQRVMQLMPKIVGQFQPDIAIVACNTASTVVLPMLRAEYQFPIVGVVPAIKPACQMSKSRQIGLLATPGTLKRIYTNQLIERFAKDCTVIKAASSKLVSIAEQKMYDNTVDLAAIELELTPFIQADNCDVLVLACTHYPLLNKEITSVFNANNKDIELLDSGSGIARRVDFLIGDKCVEPTDNDRSIAVFSKELENKQNFINNLRKLGLRYIGRL